MFITATGERTLMDYASCTDPQVTQQEFTEMARQEIVPSPEVAKESNHQIAETAPDEGIARTKKWACSLDFHKNTGVDNSRLLIATVKFTERQPREEIWKN